MGDYNSLTSLIGTYQELSMFRRFAKLNAKSLVYMQAELVHLEAELAGIESEDKASKDPNRSSFHVSVFNLKESSGTENDIQWQKVLAIREKLRLYSSFHEAILQYSQVQKLKSPSKQELGVLQEWLDRPEGGDFFLQGREADMWQSLEDVVSLSTHQANEDLLTWLISNFLIPWYHERWGYRSKHASSEAWTGLWHYEHATLVAIVNVVSTILSALLPSGSIFVLYFLKKPIMRLIAIMVFATLFSGTLAMISKARRADIFAATTAFAAVQAVFVGGAGLCSY
ncbi:MAG: hypothetical protein Q9167_003375 [Letrouitia subvulpina]